MLRTLTTTAALVLTAFSLAVPAQRFTPAEGADPLHVPAQTYSGWSKEQQIAFWLNAYDAFVLETVVDNYPIRARLATFPANSIKQIAGAFEGTKHRAAGRMVTLDEIEKTILPEFQDPRVYFARGRAATSSRRLRSEAYTAQRLRAQLESVQKEFVNYQEMVQVDRVANTMSVTPIFSWRDTEFVAAYDPGESGTFAQRSPIERAIIAFVMPSLLSLEKELLQKNQFKVQ